MVEYSSKSAPGTYRFARVMEVEVDDVDGLVLVGYYNWTNVS